MLARKTFLIREDECRNYDTDISTYMGVALAPLLMAVVAGTMGILAHDEIGMILYHISRDYILIHVLAVFGAIGTNYKYILAATNEEDLRYRVWRTVAFGFWIPIGLLWESVRGLGKGIAYVFYELPIKTTWKKINTTRKHAYELEHADELLIAEQKDIQRLIGK